MRTPISRFLLLLESTLNIQIGDLCCNCRDRQAPSASLSRQAQWKSKPPQLFEAINAPDPRPEIRWKLRQIDLLSLDKRINRG
ncbi:unnamed protein product [Cuscuta epithymum]|uniref:Uncharacterized protein n=1 Tax=Cuscuta epithymum TaxID=186058 RepID=A0AAV0D5E3_9ASTE|nr:unnamed protein product [Cuscuta epithymum]